MFGCSVTLKCQAEVLVLLSLLLLTGPTSGCQWVTDSCQKLFDVDSFLDSLNKSQWSSNGSILDPHHRKCKAILHWVDSTGDYCDRWDRVKYVTANSSHPCNLASCNFVFSLCPWSKWLVPKETCGEAATLWTRTRVRCCNPVTGFEYPKSRCSGHYMPDQETMRVTFVPCKTQYYVAAGVVALMILAIGIFIFVSHIKRRCPRSEPAATVDLTEIQITNIELTPPPSYEEVIRSGDNPCFDAEIPEELPKYDDVVSRQQV